MAIISRRKNVNSFLPSYIGSNFEKTEVVPSGKINIEVKDLVEIVFASICLDAISCSGQKIFYLGAKFNRGSM